MFLVTFLPTSKSIGAVHYYVQDDLLTKEQIRYIRDNFCKQIVEGVVEDEYIKNEKAELEFLKYINSLNIDLYIFQAKSTIESKLVLDPFNKNKKSRKEMFESRKYFISFLNYNSEKKYGLNYSYYTEKDTFTEEDIVYIKKEFCDEYELIKDDNAHDQFLNFSKEKGVIFRRLEENIDDSLIEFSDSSRASKSVIYYYNLNKKDLEKEGNQLEYELVSFELKIKDILTSCAGRGKTCRQEANSFNI